jgi:hypothetical protein
MPDEMKPKAALHMIANGVLQIKSLKYVDPQFFMEHIFKSPLLDNPNLGIPILATLKNN